MGPWQCGPQVWCWLVSTVVCLVLVERQLDLSSVATRLRGRPVWFVQLPVFVLEFGLLGFWGNFPTEPVTYEAHPYFLQSRIAAELGRRLQ
ncbi:hypothetical protein Taro_044939 [Colocasia esculenta]|uniref:Uncharacterized protein n=1 Tax=Colocasia esculenta TaxID=4460 RepID=A0A843WPZ5_COLES|nr:hypothetical protein [Colocasia esculenta]